MTNKIKMGSPFKVRPTHSVTTDELVAGFAKLSPKWMACGGRGTA